MCYIYLTMQKPPPFHHRSSKGEQRFLQYVIPRIQDHFPGAWYSTNGSPADWEHGVDFINVNGHQVQTISARVWMSMDRRNFTSRHYRTSAPEIKLEYDTKLEAFRTGGYLTDWTVEAFIHRTGLSIGAVPTHQLYSYLDRVGDLATKFIIQNPQDHVYFRKVPWDELDTVTWWFSPLP